mmetsp:Transcript_98823/g.166399  ORF Transcript_98823/g.166399 Transcript_98823/m.166399 type:complete len:173 (-) Transcript_98823:164-682(-)
MANTFRRCGPNLAPKAPEFFFSYLVGGYNFAFAPCVYPQTAQNFMENPKMYARHETRPLTSPIQPSKPGCWDRTTQGGLCGGQDTPHPKPHTTVNTEEQPTWAPAAPRTFFGPLWTGAQNSFPDSPFSPPFRWYFPDLCTFKMLWEFKGIQECPPPPLDIPAHTVGCACINR